jgi:hypothetical protein
MSSSFYGGYPGRNHPPYGNSRRPSYRPHSSYNRAPPRNAGLEPGTFPNTLAVCVRVKRDRDGTSFLKIHTWTGKSENTVLDPECKKYIKREMRKSADHYKVTRGGLGMNNKREAAFSMDFRINRLLWNEERGRLTITQVQPDIHSFSPARLRR